jgi:DNA-binding NarL/FixJ family response regulator
VEVTAAARDSRRVIGHDSPRRHGGHREETTRHWRKEEGERWERLTGRERSVLRLLLQGLSNADIGRELNVMVKTVESHVTRILRKLCVASRQEAIVWAYRHLPADLYGDPRQI